MPAPKPKPLTAAEIGELHALPDDAFVTTHEAAALLRLKPDTLVWYRAQASFGPPYTRVGPKAIRYRMGDLRDHAKRGQPMGDGVRRAADAALAARVAKGLCHG